MLKSPSKDKLVKKPQGDFVMLFSYNTERFNITYAVFQLRFRETFSELSYYITLFFFIEWVLMKSYNFR